MSTWFSLYVHDAEPRVCSGEGRVWVQFMVDGPPGMAAHTVTLMLKKGTAKPFAYALLDEIEKNREDEPAETLANG